MVITSALHAEGPGFEPQWNQRPAAHFRALPQLFIIFFKDDESQFRVVPETGNLRNPLRKGVSYLQERRGADGGLREQRGHWSRKAWSRGMVALSIEEWQGSEGTSRDYRMICLEEIVKITEPNHTPCIARACKPCP